MTANIYPPLNLSHDELISPYISTAHDTEWPAQDAEFCTNLTQHWKTRRDVYRAFLIKGGLRLKELDRIPITLSDRENAGRIIANYQQVRIPHNVI